MLSMLLHVGSHLLTYLRAYTGGREFVFAAMEGKDPAYRAYVIGRLEAGWRLESKVCRDEYTARGWAHGGV